MDIITLDLVRALSSLEMLENEDLLINIGISCGNELPIYVTNELSQTIKDCNNMLGSLDFYTLSLEIDLVNNHNMNRIIVDVEVLKNPKKCVLYFIDNDNYLRFEMREKDLINILEF